MDHVRQVLIKLLELDKAGRACILIVLDKQGEDTRQRMCIMGLTVEGSAMTLVDAFNQVTTGTPVSSGDMTIAPSD
jgi:hypothetical protein